MTEKICWIGYFQQSIRVRLFWVKMISRNHFHPYVWLSRKMIFSGKWFPVDQYFHLWPGNDFLPSFSLQNFFGKRKRERERARARERGEETEQSVDLQAASISSPSFRWRRSPVRALGGVISRRSRSRAIARSRSRDRAVASSHLRSRSTARDHAVARSRSRAVASSRRWSRDRVGEIAISDRDHWWYFSWVCVFLFLFQTPENIFRKIFWNATKHGKIFSFSGN